jgi:hypothetical protein
VACASGLLAVLPVLTGAWAGGALIGREPESGTAEPAWTQSVTPARRPATKLTAPTLLLVPGALAIILLHRALWASDSHLTRVLGRREWHDDSVFEANGASATAAGPPRAAPRYPARHVPVTIDSDELAKLGQ